MAPNERRSVPRPETRVKWWAVQDLNLYRIRFNLAMFDASDAKMNAISRNARDNSGYGTSQEFHPHEERR